MPNKARRRTAPDIRIEYKRLSGGKTYHEVKEREGRAAADAIHRRAEANVR